MNEWILIKRYISPECSWLKQVEEYDAAKDTIHPTFSTNPFSKFLSGSSSSNHSEYPQSPAFVSHIYEILMSPAVHRSAAVLGRRRRIHCVKNCVKKLAVCVEDSQHVTSLGVCVCVLLCMMLYLCRSTIKSREFLRRHVPCLHLSFLEAVYHDHNRDTSDICSFIQ